MRLQIKSQYRSSLFAIFVALFAAGYFVDIGTARNAVAQEIVVYQDPR